MRRILVRRIGLSIVAVLAWLYVTHLFVAGANSINHPLYPNPTQEVTP